jgi:small conductance mechanosensitive channel
MDMNTIIPKLQELAVFYGIKIIIAVVIFIVGRWIAKALKNVIQKMMAKRNVEATIASFLCNMSYVVLMTIVIIATLNQFGIQTASLIAIVGAAGLAIGLALQGSLANFAAGFLMLVFRPFKTGDYIEGAGTQGTVEEIHIFTTQLKTPDNKTVIIPNAKLMGDNIINYSAKDKRRVDLVIGVSYSDNLQKVRQVLEDVLSKDNRVLKDPGDSSVNFAVRPWVKTDDYWTVYFDLTEDIKKRFDAESISIPFPQQDVHLYKHGAELP